MKLNGMSFALAGGVYLAVIFALAIVLDRLGFSGAHAITNGLIKVYASLGVTRTWLGLAMSIISGFITGFLAIGFFGLLYNSMVGNEK